MPATPTTAAVHDAAGAVAAAVEEQREELVALCGRLVEARSVNPPGDTRAAAGVVAEALAARGVEGLLEADDPTMPSVMAVVESGRPGPHLVLNVHLDTMPPGDEDAWSVDPWRLTRRDGRLYGLGMGNMKGAVAAMVVAAGLLAERRDGWCGRITFTAVSDEVVFGEHGAAHLLRTHPELLADGLLCGEGPGFRRLAVAEKGVCWLEVRSTGTPGHSSSVRPGESASARIAEAVRRIDALTGTLVDLPADLADLAADRSGRELTANVGTVRAGSFIGQVATEAVAEVDLRVPPGLTADTAEAMVRAAVADIPGTSVHRRKGWDPNWTAPAGRLGTAWAVAAAALGDPQPELAVRLPASDASRWRLRDVEALCYGPQPTLSAGIDDHAEEDEVLRCARLYALASLAFLAPERGA